MQLTTVQFSDIGDRRLNQDYCGYIQLPEGALLFVADGVGGHQGGEIAAQTFGDALVTCVWQLAGQWAKAPEATMQRLFKIAWQHMGRQLQGYDKDVNMHTTCVAAWLDTERCVIGHVGDSRAYLVSPEQMIWRSRDHSVVERLVQQGEITAEQAATHPQRNKIYRSVSRLTAPEPSMARLPALSPDQLLILCSDGLWGYTQEEELCALCTQPELHDPVSEMVAQAVERGHPRSDNTTVVCTRRLDSAAD